MKNTKETKECEFCHTDAQTIRCTVKILSSKGWEEREYNLCKECKIDEKAIEVKAA